MFGNSKISNLGEKSMQKAYSVLLLLLWKAVCLKQSRSPSFYCPSSVHIAWAFQHVTVCLHPWHNRLVVSFLFSLFFHLFSCFWQSTWHTKPPFLRHCAPCIYLSFAIFIHFVPSLSPQNHVFLSALILYVHSVSLTLLHLFSCELSALNFILYVLLPSHPFICGLLPFSIYCDLNHSVNVHHLLAINCKARRLRTLWFII